MRKAVTIILGLLFGLTATAQTESPKAKEMKEAGFIDIQKADSSILVNLMYAKSDNFVGKVLYKDLKEAYLHPKAVEALIKAQKLLKQIHPSYRLIVYDATRPMSIQQQMWDTVVGTPSENYVSDPANGGGTHNYGFAVDVSIYDTLRKDTIPMGVKVDYLFSESNIDKEDSLLLSGKISAEAKGNRELLRYIMTEAGYKPLRSEYWHFNYAGYNRNWLMEHGYKAIK